MTAKSPAQLKICGTSNQRQYEPMADIALSQCPPIRRFGNAEVSRELERLIDAVTQGVDLATMVPRIKALETERADIAGKLQCADSSDIVTLHPVAIEQYRADVERLAALAAEHSDFAESAELIEAVRRLVAQVIVRAAPHGRGFSVEVQGRLAQLTNSALFPSCSEGGERPET
jgi:site-specific DNA recombinase